jgi:ADP-ribose pyrophosphatase YjhB (NUDIX family)
MPKIEVRAAALMVKDGKVLLVNHRKHGRSYWVLPGGHVEFGETLEQALVREMKEELALDVAVGALVIVHDFITDDRHVVNNTFRVESQSSDFRVTPEHALKAARWVPLDELPSLDLLPPMAKALRSVIDSPSAATLYLGKI